MDFSAGRIFLGMALEEPAKLFGIAKTVFLAGEIIFAYKKEVTDDEPVTIDT